MINWKNRLRNKQFISAMISIILLTVKNIVGIELPYELDTIVELLLTVISTLGIIIDPNTEGFSDIKEKEELEETYDVILEVVKILCDEKQ